MNARRLAFPLIVLVAASLSRVPLVAESSLPLERSKASDVTYDVAGEQERQRTEEELRADERTKKEKDREDRRKLEAACRDENTRPDNCPPPPTSLINVTAGYTVVRYSDPRALPVGWSIGVTAKPTRFFAIVSELSVAYDSDRAGRPGTHRTAVLFLDGVRVMAPWGRVTPFGEALLGVAHDLDFRLLATDKNRFVWKPGGGVDVRLSPKVAVRFQGGVILDPVGDESSNVFQFTSGLVFGR